jgi:radical SAM protein with 4Fe4S-binding SPASM domain
MARRKYRTQEPPYCIQIELTEGCNLRCNFCGLQAIRSVAEKGKNYKFMTEETLRNTLRTAMAAKWNPRIEFAMHGEPSMHPDYVGMVKVAREEAPRLQIMMTSNGGGMLRKPGAVQNIRALFDAGLNVLALDDYIGIGFVPKIRDQVHAALDQFQDVEIYEYPEQPEGNPHRRHSPRYRMLSFVQDITIAHKGTHAVINNHAGCGAPPLPTPMKQRCAKPFREFGVRWDGEISGCCVDWRNTYRCGNVNDTSIEKIWNGPAMGALREVLYRADRGAVDMCSGCDHKTYRLGLLPDKLGKETLHKPDQQTKRDIADAQKAGPQVFSAVPWDKQ